MIYHGAGRMFGVGEGLERGAGHILNAVMMKKRLEMAKQAADTEKMKTEADVRRSDAYTSYLNNQDIMKRVMDAHDLVPQILKAMQAKTTPVNGPGATANQLATRNAPLPMPEAPSIAESRGGFPGPMGVAMAQANPVPPRRSPTQGAPLTLIPPNDPRTLLPPQVRPMYADDEA